MCYKTPGCKTDLLHLPIYHLQVQGEGTHIRDSSSATPDNEAHGKTTAIDLDTTYEHLSSHILGVQFAHRSSGFREFDLTHTFAVSSLSSNKVGARIMVVIAKTLSTLFYNEATPSASE